MNRIPLKKTVLAATLGSAMFAAALPVLADTAIHPAEMSREDIAGAIFDRPDTLIKGEGADTVKDVTSLLSSDGRFASGMYMAGKSRWVIDEPYGVDEFMYFLEGGVTLTSSDGSITEIAAGEAVTIPKEWTGIWETDGYKKIWVIYSEDGSGLE
ncbi:cupin domain-containing protein [Congregibacter litoralis]|uniref:Putative enzyme of the cupin superfamily n=1 Tax=Congregibacter litoralis KT71 TaxID=314285 RepID=A4A8D8_9GAMM|nr:cupin domain-containing protein [Congregibacter litoralis]EAQ97933.1 putative enzyme of the cupin superfamily [Congregibacter litoralis KT71]